MKQKVTLKIKKKKKKKIAFNIYYQSRILNEKMILNTPKSAS